MKFKYLIKSLSILFLVLILLITAALPAFAADNGHKRTALDVMPASVAILLIALSPLFMVFAIYEALVTGTGNIFEIMAEYFSDLFSTLF